MSNNGPFGFDPDDFDRMVREAGEVFATPWATVFQQSGQRPGWSTLFDQAGRRARPEPETTGDIGDGVWAIFIVSDEGIATVEQVYASRDSTRCGPTSTTPTPSGRSGSCRTASPSPRSTNRTTSRSTNRSDRVAEMPPVTHSERVTIRRILIAGTAAVCGAGIMAGSAHATPAGGRLRSHRAGQGHHRRPGIHRHRRSAHHAVRPERDASPRRRAAAGIPTPARSTRWSPTGPSPCRRRPTAP